MRPPINRENIYIDLEELNKASFSLFVNIFFMCNKMFEFFFHNKRKNVFNWINVNDFLYNYIVMCGCISVDKLNDLFSNGIVSRLINVHLYWLYSSFNRAEVKDV